MAAGVGGLSRVARRVLSAWPGEDRAQKTMEKLGKIISRQLLHQLLALIAFPALSYYG